METDCKEKYNLKKDIEKTYGVKVKGGWDERELHFLHSALAEAADLAGGIKNLQDIFLDGMAANGHSTTQITFDNRAGGSIPAGCGGGYACWDYNNDRIVLSDHIFTPEYQYAQDRFRPKELGLKFNLVAGIEVTMIHEMSHVFADARPNAVSIYEWRVPNLPNENNAEERMANTIAFYAVSGMYDWPGKPNNFDFVRDIDRLWQATP